MAGEGVVSSLAALVGCDVPLPQCVLCRSTAGPQPGLLPAAQGRPGAVPHALQPPKGPQPSCLSSIPFLFPFSLAAGTAWLFS